VITRSWSRKLSARAPRTIRKVPARYLAAPLLGRTDTTDMDEASDGSPGFIESAGI
jgi:hypothetical protein